MTSTPFDELVEEIHRVLPKPDDMDAWEAIYRPRPELGEQATNETSSTSSLTSSPLRPQVTNNGQGRRGYTEAAASVTQESSVALGRPRHAWRGQPARR